MIDTAISYLSEALNAIQPSLQTIVNIAIVFLWVLLIKKLKISFQISIKISLFLLVISIFLTILESRNIAGSFAEYAFLFLSIGVLQKVLLNK